MNGDLVHEESSFLAKRIATEAGEDRGTQIDKAFERILSREPSAQERSQFRDDGGPLDSICRVLLNSNEFLYVE